MPSNQHYAINKTFYPAYIPYPAYLDYPAYSLYPANHPYLPYPIYPVFPDCPLVFFYLGSGFQRLLCNLQLLGVLSLHAAYSATTSRRGTVLLTLTNQPGSRISWEKKDEEQDELIANAQN